MFMQQGDTSNNERKFYDAPKINTGEPTAIYQWNQGIMLFLSWDYKYKQK